MISYKELGLVNTREMFKRAVAGGYAIPAFNFNTMEQMQAIVMAAVETKSPVIMQVSKGARNYANGTILRNLAKGAVEYAKELGCEHPEIVLHLDHGDTFELCKDCIDNGFSSVMIDGSSLPYEENIALAKKVVDYAHQFDVTVEAELGVLAGVEDEVQSAESHYTKPEEVIDFSTRTGCDSLAISIGTHPARNREETPRFPHRAPRFFFSSNGRSEHHQQVRRSPRGCYRHSRRATPQGCQVCRLQNQHRLRLSSGHDGCHPQALG